MLSGAQKGWILRKINSGPQKLQSKLSNTLYCQGPLTRAELPETVSERASKALVTSRVSTKGRAMSQASMTRFMGRSSKARSSIFRIASVRRYNFASPEVGAVKPNPILIISHLSVYRVLLPPRSCRPPEDTG